MAYDEDVDLAKQGDIQAFNRLHDKYRDRLVKTLFRRIKDMDDAEDMAQEAFIKAYDKLGSFRGESDFFTWLARIGINASNNYFGKINRRPPLHDVSADEVDIEQQDSPDAIAEMEQTKDQLEVAFYSMIPEFRQCLEMRLINDLPYDDIADKVGIPVGTVRSRISRGKREINKHLNGE